MKDFPDWRAPYQKIKGTPEETARGLRARITLLEHQNKKLQARVNELEDLLSSEALPNGKHFIGKRKI